MKNLVVFFLLMVIFAVSVSSVKAQFAPGAVLNLLENMARPLNPTMKNKMKGSSPASSKYSVSRGIPGEKTTTTVSALKGNNIHSILLPIMNKNDNKMNKNKNKDKNRDNAAMLMMNTDSIPVDNNKQSDFVFANTNTMMDNNVQYQQPQYNIPDNNNQNRNQNTEYFSNTTTFTAGALSSVALGAVAVFINKKVSSKKRGNQMKRFATGDTKEEPLFTTNESNDSSSSYVIPGEPIYPGIYCDWSVTPKDTLEVWSYRACLSSVAVSVLACSSVVFFQDVPINLDVAYFLGASSLGVALYLIHIYVDPIKKAFQLMWLTGFIGSVSIAINIHDTSVPAFVATHPWSIWLIGPMFASLTGVAFKEGLCYGKLECAALFFVIPMTLLGHLTGFGSEDFEKGLILAWCVLISVFAARKYTQEVKDDIGDKSIFIFNDLSENEKKEWVLRARQRDPVMYARMMGEE